MSSKAEPNTPDYTAMSGPQLLAELGDNAAAWAAAFCQHAKKLGHGDIDEGWMIGWFANAIENSTDVRRRRSEPSVAPARGAFP